MNKISSTIIQKLFNRETISYVLFGVLTTLVDWVTYTICRAAQTDYRIATIIAWCAAVLFAYITNKLFVFKSKSFEAQIVAKEIVPFVLCRLVSGVLNLVCMIIAVDLLSIHDFAAKVVTSVAVLVLNYIFSKLFIFKQQS